MEYMQLFKRTRHIHVLPKVYLQGVLTSETNKVQNAIGSLSLLM